MNHIRRITVALSLTVILAAPMYAMPSGKDRSPEDRPAIVRLLMRLVQKVRTLVPTDSSIQPPFPPPSDYRG
jgi:hypothetical protein